MPAQTVVQIVGYKNSGKTTLVSRLVSSLNRKGYRAGTIKHASHRFDIDHPGTDSWQHREAGAEVVSIVSQNQTAVIEQRSVPLEQLLERMASLDFVFIEGFKTLPFPKIVTVKEESDQALLNRVDNVIVAACWNAFEDAAHPVIAIDDTERILSIVLKRHCDH